MKLMMQLLSDALPGSGEGLAGIIDIDVTLDGYGIPYIPSKRIKGILRESAKELIDAKKLNLNAIELFGESGADEGCEFRISNGRIPKYQVYHDLLSYTSAGDNNRLKSIFNREQVLDYFTYTRSQTSIDDFNGTAMKDSLRTCRVLKKGLIFEFDLKCNRNHIEYLKTIAKVTRHFGNSRTRGPGHIKMWISGNGVEEKNSEHSPVVRDEFNDETLCSIPLTIENISPLLATIKVGEDQVSEKFIPGSIILGAIARKYIKYMEKNRRKPEDDVTFRELFVSGKLKFTNAYPYENGQYFKPSPKSVLKVKNLEEYYDFANENDRKRFRKKAEKESIQTKGSPGDFIYMSAFQFEKISIPTHMEYHHRRAADKSVGRALKPSSRINFDPGTFFQFNVISSGQHFRGKITGKLKYLKELLPILHNRMTLYLGKSKTAQYGKSIVEVGEIEEEFFSPETWRKGEPLRIVLESDMILRNENGFISPDVMIFISEFAKILEVDKDIFNDDGNKNENRFFLKYKMIGGFLGVWNLPKQQSPAVAAGSVIVLYNNTNSDIDLSKLRGVSFGERTEEGFGRIYVNVRTYSVIGVEEFQRGGPIAPNNLVEIKDFIESTLYSRLRSKWSISQLR